MHTRISLAQFGVLFAVLIALGAVAHADRRTCGQVQKVVASEKYWSTTPGRQTTATITIDGFGFDVENLGLAQLALAAKANGQRVCVVEKYTDHPGFGQGTRTWEHLTELTIEDEVHP